MNESQEQTKYYVSLGWWILRLSIVIFILIPGSLPLIFGYIFSFVYRFFDPDLIAYNTILLWYRSTIGQWSLFTKISLIIFVLLFIVVPYWVYLRNRHPGMNVVEISKAEVKQHVNKLGKPENPKIRKTRDIVAD